MLIIRNKRLFNELQQAHKNGACGLELWRVLFQENFEPKDNRIRGFLGGLDHVEVTPEGVAFIDSGCNDWDNSFMIKP